MDFHEIANIFPMMQSDEYENLVADIKQNGLIEPIVLYDGKILDGRNRWKACIEAGVEPRFENYSGDSPISYVISKNANRRHLSKSQLAMIATEVLPMLEEEAEKRKIANLKQNKADVELVPHRSIGQWRTTCQFVEIRSSYGVPVNLWRTQPVNLWRTKPVKLWSTHKRKKEN